MENEDKKQVKEPVKIRFKELKNGNQSIYLIKKPSLPA